MTAVATLARSNAPRIRVGCIGLPSTALPALGLEGVAVWPVCPATGRMSKVVGMLRRHLTWRTALIDLPMVEHVVLCDPPKWVRRSAHHHAIRVTIVADAKSALRTIAAA